MNSFLGNGVLAKTQIPQIHTNMGNLGKKEIDIAQVSDFFSQSTGFVLDPGLAASRFAPIHLAAAILEGGSLRNLEQDWLRRTFPYSWPQPSWRGIASQS